MEQKKMPFFATHYSATLFLILGVSPLANSFVSPEKLI